MKLWEVIDDPNEDKLYLVMDLVKKGAVMSKGYWRYETRQALNRSGISVFDAGDASMIGDTVKRVLTEEKALKYFRELILGLDYLHNHVGVIHRDIKPENLLVDEFDTLKISDFGVSSLMEDNSDELKNNAGTKLFLPPESFEGNFISEREKYHSFPCKSRQILPRNASRYLGRRSHLILFHDGKTAV